MLKVESAGALVHSEVVGNGGRPTCRSFGGKAAVDGRFNAQHKLATEFFFAQRVGHGEAVRVNQFNHFLDGLT